MITADDFEKAYAERSKISVADLRAHERIVWPCDCLEPECEGWQSISVENARDDYIRLKWGGWPRPDPNDPEVRSARAEIRALVQNAERSESPDTIRSSRGDS